MRHISQLLLAAIAVTMLFKAQSEPMFAFALILCMPLAGAMFAIEHMHVKRLSSRDYYQNNPDLYENDDDDEEGGDDDDGDDGDNKPVGPVHSFAN